MNCFVLGATGFLGSHIVDGLLDRGDTVLGLTSNPDKVPGMKNKGIRPVVGDIRSPEQWMDEVERADVVVQAAMLPLPNRPSKSYVVQTIETERNLLSHLFPRLKNSTALVYTSGTGIYGDGFIPCSEHYPTRPLARSRKDLHAERMILEAVEREDIRATIMRPAPIYGPGGIFHKFWGERLARGKRVICPGKGDQIFSFISVWDCARAYLLAIDAPSHGEIYNVTDDEPVHLKEFLYHTADLLDAPKPLHLSKVLFRLLAGRIYANAMFSSFPAKNDKIKKELGFKPAHSTYREGCAALAEAYRGDPPEVHLSDRKENSITTTH